MRQYGLVPADIAEVLDEQNVEAATGTLGAEASNTFQYVLKYRGRYENEVDYENLVIKSLPGGEVLRLKDVATIELGTRAYDYINEVNGHPGCNIMIAQTSGSNANEIIEEIDRTVDEISKTLPKGIKIVDLMSTKDFLDASIKNVIKTLVEAIVLVVLVVYVFLQSLRSTFIPALSIIVSLVGTFCLSLCGRLQPEYAYFICVGACNRNCSRRRHRGCRGRSGQIRRGLPFFISCHGRCHGRYHVGARHYNICFHGCVYSCEFHRRYHGYILHSVWTYYGCCCCHIAGQCVDVESGFVLTYNDSTFRYL